MTDNERRYPGNSHKPKTIVVEEAGRARLNKVIKGDAKLKKPLGRRIAESFNGDDMRTVGQHVLFEIVIPSIKDLIVDAGKDALERAFFGTTTPRSRSSRSGSSYTYGNRSSYSDKYRGRNFERDQEDREDRRPSRRERTRGNFEEVILETRGDAEEALDAMRAAIEQFSSVSVADLYDLVDITSDYMDRAWGWEDLEDAKVIRLRSDLYALDLPPAIKLS